MTLYCGNQVRLPVLQVFVMESQALTHKTEMVNKMKDYKKLE